MTIFIPKKIRVGFQNRKDTYTGKLAYVIYYDAKGKIRKETSWSQWRNKDIEPLELDNEPLTGFVLNKKVGGYKSYWNFRQTYVRVYDPREFEFEITIPNLIWVLENSSSIVGKGLEGEFVYGWDSGELLLIPTSSPDYAKIMSFSKTLRKPESLKGKDLVLGGTYRTNLGKEWIYLGRFERYIDYQWGDKKFGTPMGKHYFFYGEDNNGTGYKAIKSLSSRVVGTISDEPVHNYAEMMDDLEHRAIYSPVDESKTEFVPVQESDLQPQNWLRCYVDFEEIRITVTVSRYNDGYSLRWSYYGDEYRRMNYRQKDRLREFLNFTSESLDELMAHYNLLKRNRYLMNGKLLKE